MCGGLGREKGKREGLARASRKAFWVVDMLIILFVEIVINKSRDNFVFSINLDYLEKWYTWKIWDWINLTLEGLRK